MTKSRSYVAHHGRLVMHAVAWLRRYYKCGVILSEQYCATGEVPDVIAWKGFCKSVLVECKVSRADFLADATKPFRLKPEDAMGSQRFILPRPESFARETCRAIGDSSS